MTDRIQHESERNDAGPDNGKPAGLPSVIDSQYLFGQCQEVAISHKGQMYRLRITRNDKLILTK